MRSLSLYVLRQIVGPVALFAMLMTCVVWLTQSLRLLDLVINGGQSAAIFAYLTVLILPSLLQIILPIAFFAGALYALHRLNSDSELIVMYSAGFSRTQLAIPVLIAAGGVMILTWLCSLYLMPLGQRTMKDKVFDIRADIGAAILREGTFTTPGNGLTVFIRELGSTGEIRGILVHDNREAKRPVTYLAESGVVAQTQDGTRLIMLSGNIQVAEDAGKRLSVLKFDKYIFDLDQFASPQRQSSRETSERYLSELFNPDFQNARQERNRGAYLAEAHNRLSSPLYGLAFALIALAATAKGRHARSSYAMRMFGASLAVAGLRLGGYALQALAAHEPNFAILLYVVPLAGAGVGGMSLAGVRLHPFGTAVPAQEPAP